MEKKPFFFRIDAGELLDFATDPEGESVSLLRFAKDLQKGQSDIVFIQKIIDEAYNYIEKKKKAGSAGGKAKASSAKAVLKQRHSSALAKSSTPLASNSNSSIKDLKKEKSIFAENVTMTEEEYKKLLDEHGKEKTLWMIQKLNNAKGAKGYKYKSDYRAILSWVVDKASKEFKPARDPMAGY